MSDGRVRSSKKKRADLVADFETTTTADDCRVWAWGLAYVSEPDTVEIGQDLVSFLERIAQESSVVYFHNLKFDGTFILDWMLKHGYEHSTNMSPQSPGEFTTLISDMGKWYQMSVMWGNGNTTQFRDSLKKLPMSVSHVAKSFKLEEGKGEIDYEAPRPVGHVITADESDYIRRDVSIVAHALKLTMAEGMTKLTVASDSLAEYKQLFGGKMFDRMFPVLSSDIDAEIRKAYRGGFTYADPRHTKKITRSGLVLDVNSLYPHIMYSTMLPYGEPVYSDTEVLPTEEYPLTIFSLTFTAKLKKDHIPVIQIKGSSMFLGTEYLREVKEPTTLMITSVDYELWLEHYDVTVLAFEGGWRFKGVQGVFKDYIDKWSAIKARETGGKREIAKLQLNSLYGKFASNPNVTSKIPYLKDGHVAYYTGQDETRAPVYTAMGVFITAYARSLTIRAAQANYDSFAYADTDSLHLLRDDVPTEINVHPTERGAWKLEYHFQHALYVRAKAYMEQLPDGSYVNHIAGVPERVAAPLTFDDAKPGAVFHGKLQPENVPGGVILKNVPYELKM